MDVDSKEHPSFNSNSNSSSPKRGNSPVENSIESGTLSPKSSNEPKNHHLNSNGSTESNSVTTPTSRVGNKVLRPDGGMFRRVMTELYIAADRHKSDNNRLPSNSNNWTKSLPVSQTSPPPPPPIVETSTKPSSCDDEDSTPQPEEDIFWKKLEKAHLHEVLF